MPISGTFLADFESFYAASQKATVSLTSFETGGAKVEKQLNRVADAFSGKRVIQEATLMARVFADAGGAATFTTAELRRMGAVGAEAMEKLRKSSQPIPEQLMAMGRATRSLGDAAGGGGGAAGKVEKLGLSVGQADALLGRFGVNLPPQVRGLADLASMAGAAGAGVGLLGPAALIVGTALTSWEVGKWIGEVSGLTNAVEKGAAKMLGFGDVAGEEAAAGADVLARATASAKRPITDMGEAMAINEAAAKGMIAANTKAAAAARQLAADDTKAAAIMVSNHEKLVKVEHELAVAQAESRGVYADMARDSAAAIANASKDVASAQAAEREGAAETGRAWQEVDIARQQAHAKLVDDARRGTAALWAEQEAAAALARSLGNSIEYDLSSPGGLEQFKRLNPGATFQGAAARPEYFQTHTLADAVRDGLISYGRYANSNPLGPYSTGGNSPGPVGRLLVADLGPEAIRADGRGTSGGLQVYAPVHVSGVFDPSAKEALSSAVRSGLSRAISAGRH